MITRFMDMNSGGGCKTDWAYILIDAPMSKALAYFEERFDRDPHNVSCPCCGGDYSIDEYESLAEATKYDRNGDETVEQYLQRPEVLFVPAADIK